MLFSSLAAPLAAQVDAGGVTTPQWYELRKFSLRNGPHAPRFLTFLENTWTPAWKRVGGGPLGWFQPSIGEESPSVLMLGAYRNAGDAATSFDRLMGDTDFAAAYRRLHTPEPAFIGMEATLLRAFRGMPTPAIPPALDGGRSRLFELRTYGSNSQASLATKIEMFNGGEIGIFQRIGMRPVFFGEAIFGRSLPHLTYMLSYDDWSTRERLWKEFIADAEFTKLRTQPGYSDAEIVSQISNSLLNPLAFSAIR